MRIRHLDLIAFGPFAGARLDLGGAPGTLDLVYGPNEAGKSTTLRAISGLLFGIPHNTPDGHRHPLNELRVGARLQSRSGDELEVVRRKGRKGYTLLDREGRSLDEGLLQPLLGGATLELFTSMFGLNYETLKSSVKDMLDGKGSVGEALFAAGIGAQGVYALRTRLKDELEELYTPRGRDQKSVIKAMADVKAARKNVEETSTSARGYTEQRRALEESEREQSALAERRAALLVEQARLERLLQVSPHLAERVRLRAEIEAMGDVVRLPKDAPERRRTAVRELEAAGQELRRTREDAERREARLAELVIPESLLTVGDAVVKDIDDQRSRHVAAVVDLPKVSTQLAALEDAVKRSLAAVDPARDVRDVEQLRVGAGKLGRVRKLEGEKRALDADVQRAERELAALSVRRGQLTSRLVAQLGPGFSAALLAEPESLPIPPLAVLDRHAAALAQFASEEDALSRERSRTAQRARDVARDLDALRRAADPPTEAELARVRGARDAAIRAALGGEAPAAGALSSVNTAVRAADDVADRLRREADRVAQLASLTADEAALTRDAEALSAREAALVERRGAEEAAFRARFAAAGISPLPVDEMRAWLEEFGKLTEVTAEHARVSAELALLRQNVEKWQARWTEVAEPLGGGTPEEVVAVLDATGELLNLVDKRKEWARRIEGMKRDSARFVEELTALCRVHLPDALSLPHAEAATRLVKAYDKAKRDDAERSALVSELAERRRALESLAARERDAKERVDALLAAAKVAQLDELEEAERRSDALTTRIAECQRVEARLRELGEGATIAELEASTRGLDADQARARLTELRDEVEQNTEAREGVVRRITTLDAGLTRLSEGASGAAESLSESVTRLKREVHRYVRVKMASELLEREIERYRQANQGPIVERASQLFPRLTLGRYTGLRVGFGADDQAVLCAVRAGGPDVGVEGMSDGTRYALYLALRLASLERYAAANEPMPFVLDDVLLDLDDDRARAALGVLGEVASRTQVLFFTHHARLRELAREALGDGRLSEHVLPAAS